LDPLHRRGKKLQGNLLPAFNRKGKGKGHLPVFQSRDGQREGKVKKERQGGGKGGKKKHWNSYRTRQEKPASQERKKETNSSRNVTSSAVEKKNSRKEDHRYPNEGETSTSEKKPSRSRGKKDLFSPRQRKKVYRPTR